MSGQFVVVNPLTLEDNSVSLRYGMDGSEPDEVISLWSRFAMTGLARLSVAINTYYPKLFGGYYANYSLRAYLQKSIVSAGLCAVSREVLTLGASSPNDLEGYLEDGQEYVLLRTGEEIGVVVTWESDTGKYYSAAMIVDVYANRFVCEEIARSIEAACQRENIPCDRQADVFWQPTDESIVRSLWRRWR